jgi:hypothetical protein
MTALLRNYMSAGQVYVCMCVYIPYHNLQYGGNKKILSSTQQGNTHEDFGF